MTFTYDAKHRLASETDAGSTVTAYVYDDADRVTEKRLPGGPHVPLRVGRERQPGVDDDAARQGPPLRLHRRRARQGLHAGGRGRQVRPGVLVRPHARATRLPERRGAGHGLRRGRAADGGAPLQSRSGASRTTASRTASARSRASWPTGPASRASSSPTTGSCPQSMEFTRRGRRPLRLHDRRPGAADEREAHRGQHRVHPRAGVRRRPAGDQDRPVHDRAQRPRRRGLQDHRRQARADLRLRRQRRARRRARWPSAAPSASSRS